MAAAALSARTIQVRQGQTLSSLSRQYNVKIRYLKKLNPYLKQRGLQVGDKLHLGRARKRTTPVKRGESLYALAKRHHTTVKKLKELNPFLQKRCLRAGDRLKLPGNMSATSASPVVHQVKRGETLSGISRAYNIRIRAIKKMNPDLKAASLRIGDTIQLPKEARYDTAGPSPPPQAKPTKTIKIAVKRGDTLSRISRRYNIRLNAIRELNPGLKARSLRVGESITLPAAAADNRESTSSPSRGTAVQIKRGDTVSGISRRYNIRIRAIKAMNPFLKRRGLRVGDTLRLPKGAHAHKRRVSSRYRRLTIQVKRGQTLSHLSVKYGIDMDRLRDLNPVLKQRGLQAGDRLVVAVPKKRSSAKRSRPRRRKTPSRSVNTADLKFTWPLKGRHSLKSGRSLYIRGTPGAKVTATESGVVYYVHDYSTMGTLVAIKHDAGFFSYYLHLDENHVNVGQKVKKGQIIGTLGSHVKTVVPHRRKIKHVKQTSLRFEIAKGKQVLNPLKLL